VRRQQPGYTVSKLFLFFFLTEDAGKTLSRTSYGLSSLTEKTRKSNCLQVSQQKLQKQHFILIYIKTVSDGPARSLNQRLPAQQTGDYLTELAELRFIYQNEWNCDIYSYMFINILPLTVYSQPLMINSKVNNCFIVTLGGWGAYLGH